MGVDRNSGSGGRRSNGNDDHGRDDEDHGADTEVDESDDDEEKKLDWSEFKMDHDMKEGANIEDVLEPLDFRVLGVFLGHFHCVIFTILPRCLICPSVVI